MKPGVSHALIGLAIWAVVTAPAAWVLLWAGITPAVAPWFGVVATAAAYISRERRQSEEWFGSNRVALWKWRPRAFRDMAWPIFAALGATLGFIAVDYGAGILLMRAVMG